MIKTLIESDTRNSRAQERLGRGPGEARRGQRRQKGNSYQQSIIKTLIESDIRNSRAQEPRRGPGEAQERPGEARRDKKGNSYQHFIIKTLVESGTRKSRAQAPRSQERPRRGQERPGEARRGPGEARRGQKRQKGNSYQQFIIKTLVESSTRNSRAQAPRSQERPRTCKLSKASDGRQTFVEICLITRQHEPIHRRKLRAGARF